MTIRRVARRSLRSIWFGLAALAALRLAALDCGAADPVRPPLTALAVSMDGRSIVVGSQAGVEVRRGDDLSVERTLASQLEQTHDLKFSPDGRWLAAAGGEPSRKGEWELYEWPAGKRLRAFADHQDAIYALAWRGRSAAVVTASLDRTVVLRSIDREPIDGRLDEHSRGVLGAAMLADDETLVTAGLDDTLRVWNCTSRRSVRRLTNHVRPVLDVAVRPGSAPAPMLASISDDRTVRLWQPTIGRLIRFARLESPPACVVWSRDGDRLAVVSRDGRVVGFDPDTLESKPPIRAFEGVVYCAAIGPADELYVGGEAGRLVRVDWK